MLRAGLSFTREYLRHRLYHKDRRAAFGAVADDVRRDRVFLVGNGPSLRGMDLDRLAAEDYFLCNLAERIDWVRERSHPFYIASDARVPDGYANGRPGIDAGRYFLNDELRPKLDQAFVDDADIVWFSGARGGTLKRGLTRRPWISVPGGQTVLLSAAQIALWLGYRQILIIGCDLDYQSPAPYAYAISKEERAARRNEIKMVESTNRAFALLDRKARRNGQSIVNAGIGGKLDSLERADFESLFRA
ncbi:hypothetical protein [Martelella endophytica]|uniref:DUF115 domain-containing protein n=1 Tax=Martelella endophytica TaxID=1486262 RepID=A0A0D5LTX0_MAREN|nr:hypothetical protein [Martelella endophytica]AJY47212.1 hypothetical protein TM49_18485 [Martelella endophytica]